MDEGKKQRDAIEKLLYIWPALSKVDRKASILTIGGSYGFVEQFLESYGFTNITMVEIDPEPLPYARKHLKYTTIIEGSYPEQKFNKKFDVVICLSALFYMDLDKTIEKISSETKKSGLFYFNFFNKNAQKIVGLVKKHKKRFNHVTYLEMKDLCEKHKFSTIQSGLFMGGRFSEYTFFQKLKYGGLLLSSLELTLGHSIYCLCKKK